MNDFSGSIKSSQCKILDVLYHVKAVPLRYDATIANLQFSATVLATQACLKASNQVIGSWSPAEK